MVRETLERGSELGNPRALYYSTEKGGCRMELVKFTLQRFKMLQNFSMAFGPRINAVRGPAGAGKTSIFQALVFMKHLILGQPSGFFDEYPIDFKNLGSEENPMLQMEAVFRHGSRYLAWENHWNAQDRYTVFEKIREGPAPESMTDLLVYEHERLRIDDGTNTVTRDLKDAVFRSAMMDCFEWSACTAYMALRETLKEWAKGLILLDVLSPYRLAAVSTGFLPAFGIGGTGFTGFLAGLPADRLRRVESRIRQFFPKLVSLKPVKLPGKVVTVEYWDKNGARQLQDLGSGQLRIMALAALPELPASLIILEELETGIYPEFLPLILEELAQGPFQTLVSSYAPTEIPGGKVTTLSMGTGPLCVG